jgi:tetratricopeptide (TPR) repeat protein
VKETLRGWWEAIWHHQHRSRLAAGLVILGGLVLWGNPGAAGSVARQLVMVAGALVMIVGALVASTDRMPLERAVWMLRALHEREELDGAASVGAALLRRLPGAHCPWQAVNLVAELHVTAGLYREALQLPDRFSQASREAGALEDPESAALVIINLAEALYNLGRIDEARESLARCPPDGSPLVRNGLLVQQAWIASLAGRPAEAMELLGGVDLEAFPPRYRAEVFYTLAAARLGLGQLDDATRDALAGSKIAERPSSQRNGLFLRARIEQARGDLEAALALFQEGAAHTHRYQGGDGLLAMGDTLRKLGRESEAKAAYRLVLTRDPESAACATAKERLRG